MRRAGAPVRAELAADQQLGACRDPALVAQALTLALEWLTVVDPCDEDRSGAVPALGNGNLGNALRDGTTRRLVDSDLR